MNFELFTARKIHFNSNEQGKKISRSAVRIATLGIAIGLAVMIAAVAVVVGFKKEIRNKVSGFGSHILVTNLDANSSFETAPIVIDSQMVNAISAIDGVRRVQRFATKPGIIKTADEFQGVAVKGVDGSFDWNFINNSLTEGKVLNISDTAVCSGAIISKTIAQRLRLKLGDSFVTYFVGENVRARKFTIEGIYATNFSNYDNLFILTDIRHIQKLNGWQPDETSGIEILIDDYDNLDFIADQVFDCTANRFDRNGSAYYVQTIRDINPQIFGWLDLLDTNVWVILILMLAVAGFNMISGLLILILEKTNMIGILKSLGAADWSVRKIFLYQSFFLIGKGMFWGNVIGLAVCLAQQYLGFVKLDPTVYYVSEMPVSLNVAWVVLLNIVVFAVSALMLLLPSYVVAKISPAKSIRFE
ncbi:ABC transporter permease [Bacteroidia bacterium]|nr:ABC transporter permease [Bacteroidia bacterium]